MPTLSDKDVNDLLIKTRIADAEEGNKAATTVRIQYTLYYRQGQNPHAQFLFFYFSSSDIRKVVDRIKRHCEVMNYRFVSVRPSFVDIDADEKRATNQE